MVLIRTKLSMKYSSPKILKLILIKPGPSCSKHLLFKKLFTDKLVSCCSYKDIFKFIEIFAAKFCNTKATHIFSAKTINVLAIFQDRSFNVTLANNVKF